MAYIKQVKKGVWRVQIEKLGVRDSASFGSKAQAQDWATEREAQIVALARLNKDGINRKPLGDVLDEYVDRFSRHKAGYRHERLRIEALKRDFPWLASKPMSETTTADWARWRDERLKVVTGSSVLRDINLFSAVYHKATRELGPYCKESPLTHMDKPRENPPRKARWPWTLVKFVLRRLGYKTGEPPTTKAQEVAYALLLGLRTSMRAQEILSLCDDNTDLSARVATVNHKMQYCTGAPRKVPMQRQAVRVLAVLSKHANGAGYFTLTPVQLDGLWRKNRASMLVSGVTFHDTRAEAITRLSRKYDVLTLSAITGIRDLKTLNETYYRETADQIAARL